MTRKELEAENKVLRDRLVKLQYEAKGAHGPLGRGFVHDYASKTLFDADEARKKVEAECRPVSPEERRARCYANFL